MFIVFEGPDGSGTSTQSKLFCDRLQSEGKNVVLTAEPTQNAIGTYIRSLLQENTLPSADAMQLLFCADRAHHVAEVVSPALNSGAIVVCDRYILSTLIYGSVHDVSDEWLQQVNALFPKPTATVITLPPLDVCMERLKQRTQRDAYEQELLQQRIYERYQHATKEPNTIAIDTSGSPQESAEYAWKQLEQHLR